MYSDFDSGTMMKLLLVLVLGIGGIILYCWLFNRSETETDRALRRLEQQFNAAQSADRTVETKITNYYQQRSDDDAKLEQARKSAA